MNSTINKSQLVHCQERFVARWQNRNYDWAEKAHTNNMCAFYSIFLIKSGLWYCAFKLVSPCLCCLLMLWFWKVTLMFKPCLHVCFSAAESLVLMWSSSPVYLHSLSLNCRLLSRFLAYFKKPFILTPEH